MPILRHNGPDERRASLWRQDCVEFAWANQWPGAVDLARSPV